MDNKAPRANRYTARMALIPIPTGIIPIPVRLPCIDQQPALPDAQRLLESLAIALGSHGFTAMCITPECGVTSRQPVKLTMLAYRAERDTSLTVTIEHTQRYGLLAVARWTITDGRDLRRDSKPLGFEWDADTTSASLARRVAHALAAYEARVCTVSSAIKHKHAA